MPEKEVKKLRIVFIGPEKVGKTALVSRVRGAGMPLRYIPTPVEDEYNHRMPLLRNDPHPISLVDTTGSQTQLGMQTRNDSVVFADAIVVVFSMRDRHSFDVAMEMLRTVEATRAGRPCPVLVVGNQADEEDEDREASHDMTNAIFGEIETRRESSEIGFVVVSARDNRNINTIEHRLSDIFEPQRSTKTGLRRLIAAISRSSLHSTSSKRSRTSSIFSIEHGRSASFSVGVRSKLKRSSKDTTSGSSMGHNTLALPAPVSKRATSCPQISQEQQLLKWHVSPLGSPTAKMTPTSSAEHSRAPSELEEIIEDDQTTAIVSGTTHIPKPMSPDSGVDIVVSGVDGSMNGSCGAQQAANQVDTVKRKPLMIVTAL